MKILGPTLDITLWVAFAAGAASFLTPCLLPLVPAYLMYISETTDLENRSRKKIMIRTLGFVIGFTVIFMALGLSASLIGRLMNRYQQAFNLMSGGLIVLFGLYMLGWISPAILNREKKARAPREIRSWFSAVLMGMAFAAGWTPCFGPILGAILVSAGGEATASRGALMLFMYSLGMAVPFFLTAWFIGVADRWIARSEHFVLILRKIGGAVLLLFGILIMTGKLVVISRWLVEWMN
jgi:cytochrome c-type biogenesis protein